MIVVTVYHNDLTYRSFLILSSEAVKKKKEEERNYRTVYYST